MSQKVAFKTQDNVTIVGDYMLGAPGRVVLLLHMMPLMRSSWEGFVKKLNQADISTLAIDLRGHGESKKKDNKKLDYRDFTDLEHQESIKDVEAALVWLEAEYGTSPEEIAIVGASIGANLALQFAAHNHGIPALVLLSPGLDYHGLQTEDLPGDLQINQSVLYVASHDDKYSHESALKLNSVTSVPHDLIELDKAGHGTEMFAVHPDLMDQVVEWLKVHF